MLMSDVCGRNYDSLLELERMKFLEDLPWDSLPNDHDAFPITSEQRVELDFRMAAYEGDKDRGRLAADVIADVRRRL
jgi:putative addiction module component (TIGR02574 family)